MKKKPTVAGLVLTLNGERLLKDCLASLSFCDVLVVVDSGSQDNTAKIAEEAGAILISHAWENSAAQLHFALGYLDSHHPTDWIVSLDQDEVCSPELQLELQAAIAAAKTNLAGFMIPRCSWYYDRFLLHGGWYPDRLLRCFRRGRMWLNASGAHESLHPEGRTKKLKAAILHYPYADFHQHLQKIDSYAEQGAQDLRARGVKGGITAALLHGFGRFLRIYLLKAGFLDGKAGLINAMHGFFYAFLKYIRIQEGNWNPPVRKKLEK